MSYFTEERITWEEFNIYGADAADASSDSQDGNNESPRYEIFLKYKGVFSYILIGIKLRFVTL